MPALGVQPPVCGAAMKSSETNRNDKSRCLKSLVIGLVLGAIFGWRMYAIGSPEAMSKPVALGTETLVAWTKAVAASVGLSAWADKPIDRAGSCQRL
jgi:hypothetical protein